MYSHSDSHEPMSSLSKKLHSLSVRSREVGCAGLNCALYAGYTSLCSHSGEVARVNVEAKLKRVVARVPQQGRSRASFGRILEAAETLLSERGADDFTLNEVTVLAKVSVGAIYGYFESKDKLIQAVQIGVYEAMETEQIEGINRTAASARNLPELITGIVEVIAENLKSNRKLLRAFIFRSYADPVVAAGGTAIYMRMGQVVEEAVLGRSAEITHPDPQSATTTIHRMLYSVLSRVLGFTAQAGQVQDPMDWHAVKEETAAMATAFLTACPHPLTKRSASAPKAWET
jgi:AcrR family transcriptional regulator